MIKKIAISLGFVLIASILLCVFRLYINVSPENRLLIRQSQIANLSGCGNSLFLFDEPSQDLFFLPSTFWEPGHHDVCQGARFQVDVSLDTIAKIEKINIFSKNIGSLRLIFGEKVINTNLFLGWNSVLVNQEIDRFSIEPIGRLKLGEIIVQGKYKFNIALSKDNSRYPKIADFMGMNIFVDDPIGAYDIVDHVREYHEYVWHQEKAGQYEYSPSIPGFEFSNLYHNYSSFDRSITPVIQHSPKWLTESDNGNNFPCGAKQDPNLIDSYDAHAQYVSTFVRSFLKQGIELKYVENWNEPEKYWEGKKSYMSPAIYTALSIKDKIALSETQDTGFYNTKLVMAGLVDIKTDYINALASYVKINKAKYPWGVVNAHLYCQDEKQKIGISPEKFNLNSKVKSFVNNIKEKNPDVEIWLTEFGYDKNLDSPQRVPNIPGYTSEQVQAIWLLRSFLLLSSTGLDKAYQYMCRDTEGKGLYTSSGLCQRKNDRVEYLESWYYLKKLKAVLGAFRFVRKIQAKEPDVYIYEYSTDSGRKAYAIWVGSEGKKEYIGYDFKDLIPSGKFNFGFHFSKEINGNYVDFRNESEKKITISEKPFLILEELSKIKNHVRVDMGEITCTSENLFDEQTKDPIYQNLKPEILTVSNDKEVTVKLKSLKHISYVSIFDDEGNSEFEVSAKINGNWATFYKGKLSLYKNWQNIYLNLVCDEIRIIQGVNNSKIGEIVIYELK